MARTPSTPGDRIYTWLGRFSTEGLRELPPPPECATCTSLHLSDMDLDDRVMPTLAAFPELRFLTLGGTGLTELETRKNLPGLIGL